jgi:phosphoenolpyruvate carboxylase
MYQQWPFFQSLIDNAQISVAIADMRIAARYATLVGDEEVRQQVLGLIESEYERTKGALLHVTGQHELLDNQPTLRDSIALRNPYVDPLHEIQIRMLKELRRATEQGLEAEAADLRYIAEHTINGIAAGLQSTG